MTHIPQTAHTVKLCDARSAILGLAQLVAHALKDDGLDAHARHVLAAMALSVPPGHAPAYEGGVDALGRDTGIAPEHVVTAIATLAARGYCRAVPTPFSVLLILQI